MRTVVTADWLWDGVTRIPSPKLEIEDGRIIGIGSRATSELSPTGHQLDFPGATLAPSFFDIHIHGAAGYDVMEATPEALHAVGRFLASRGTSRYLATTVTAPLEATLKSLSGLAKLLNQQQSGGAAGHERAQAMPAGIHLEGPFLSHIKRGVHPPEYLLTPDIGLFDRFYEAAEGHIRLLTLAPELPGAAEFAAHATSKGVRISVGHSNATAAETRATIAAGARSATHTFNAMRPLDHREPGILGVVLANDDLFAELICDGIHVDPALVKLWWRAKGPHRAILVTDAMSATGMPDGEYQLGGFAVHVADGRATANGVLAGSVLTLDKALTNFLAFTGTSLEEALPLLTRNPSAMTGAPDDESRIRVGGDASFVVLDAQGNLRTTLIRGESVESGKPVTT
jgi:N-acetylglucosamine-6-phosphate deacetylase